MRRLRPIPYQRCALATLLALAVLDAPSWGQFVVPMNDGRLPGAVYFLARAPYHQGEYADALKGLQSAERDGIRTSEGPWIDGVCYFTMRGECFYHLGELAKSLEQHEVALQLFIRHRGWLKRIQFERSPFPQPAGPRITANRVPWGPSVRNGIPGHYEPLLSLQGTDPNIVLRQGGTVAPAEIYRLDVVEILRCVAVSLHRRRELLGPIARETPLTDQMVKELTTRHVPPNNWITPLLNVALGIAQVTAGDVDAGTRTLEQSLVVMGQLDHPLTSIALLNLAIVAREKSDLNAAQRMFIEATFPAVQFGQSDVLEEAFLGAAQIHGLTGGQGVFSPLPAAATWARSQRLNRAAAALLLAAAENAAWQGQTNDARGLLNQARQAMGRSDLALTRLGGWLQFQTALLACQSGSSGAAEGTLPDAVKLLSASSARQFQVARTAKMQSTQQISPRVAGILFKELLREPVDQDWQYRLMDTLAFELSPHLEYYEQWLENSVANRDTDSILLVSDMIRRHKFFAALPLGGRLLALRWVLEAPDIILDEKARQQRQQLRTKFPRLAELSQVITDASARLAQLPVLPEGEDRKSYDRAISELTKAVDQEEQLLREIALRPEPAVRMFPPLRTQEQLLSQLQPGQTILAFVMTRRVNHALLLTSDKRYHPFAIKSSSRLRSTMTALMRDIGNYDRNQVLPADRLVSTDWKKYAATLFEPLAQELTPEILQDTKELIIVPDGFLWYLPFEMLQVPQGSETKSLIEITTIRYSPTIGLALGDPRPAHPVGPRTIIQGRLFRRESDPIIQTAAERLRDQHPHGVVLRRRLPAATQYVAPAWHQLIVLDDIESADKDPLNWSPAQVDQGMPGASLAAWLALPWGAPETVVLPGYHTIAEEGMRGTTQGDELMLAACGLMGAGCRSIVFSRWRTGGQMSMEIIGEFLQELPKQSMAAAWQRSLLLARSAELDPSAEPRLKDVAPGQVPKADHPFFWAGYLPIGF